MKSSAKLKEKQKKLFLFFILLILLSIVIGTLKSIKPVEEIEDKILPVKKVQVAKFEKTVGKIAIIIDDFGYRNDDVSDGFLHLKAKLTYAVIPGHEHSRSIAKKAHQLGYEVIVHMPMESETTGKGEEKYVINENMSNAEIEKRVNNVFDHLPEAAGMNNHQGSRATASERVMKFVGSVLKAKQKYFLDSRTTDETLGESTMRSLGVPTGRRHVFLDNDTDENLIQKQLDVLVAKAKENKIAVGIGHAKQHTLNVLEKNIAKLQKQHFEFVFVSEIVD